VPRSRRHIPPNSIIHVINRGNDRRRLFDSPARYDEFRALMRHTLSREPLRLVAYVLMPNHWHLVAWPETSTQLSRFLHRLCSAHAARWRRRAGSAGQGHVYQDRFHAFTVESERQYYNVLRYVEANPLRAGLVESTADWAWSSLAERREHRADLIVPGPLALPDGWPDILDQTMPAGILADLRDRTRRVQRAAWQPRRHPGP
jgi:putative transposase